MRYERRKIIGQGGMGIVYQAWDQDLRREVALKTIRDSRDPAAFELFRKECAVLASLNHPNIIDIYDIGEIEEEGTRRPYFVMPLLPGVTLDQLVKHDPQRLSVERVVEIIAQTCRGLQAAHERGLIHRDLKPSNLFVLADDSVKIIDFGVAHLVDQQTSVGIKGTLYYMSPEQLDLKPVTPASDIFSLGVVSFEAFTRRRPFTGESRDEVARAILSSVPPPASELNSAVSQAISQVVHAALAKQPFHRYTNAREFGDSLQKALHGFTIERFDPARLEPRVERAEKALGDGEPDYAHEILAELEAEGHLHPQLRPLRRRVDQALKDRTTSRLVDTARRRLQENEYQLAFQKVQEILQIDPEHPGGLALRGEIESLRSAEQIDAWLGIARQHLGNCAFGPARDAVRSVLQTNPSHATASELLSQIDRAEENYERSSREKEGHYQRAQESWNRGDVSAALSQIEKVLDIDRASPSVLRPERAASYQEFYNRARSEHDAIQHAHDEARKHMESGNFTAASAICDHYLRKYPDHSLFQALRVDLGQRERQTLSADIAQLDRAIEAEPDLDRKVRMLEEAMAKHPAEPHFDRLLRSVRQKRELIGSIVLKARQFEEQGQFNEALSQWEIVRNIHAPYPGLQFERERVEKRKQQHTRTSAKSKWVEQIDTALHTGSPERALELVQSAIAEFPGDAELAALDKLARGGIERATQARDLVEQARTKASHGELEESVRMLRKARQVDPAGVTPKAALTDGLLKLAAAKIDSDPDSASSLVSEASAIDPAHPQARSLTALIADKKRDTHVERRLARAREMQAGGNVTGALSEITDGLKDFPLDARLARLKSTLEQAAAPAPNPPPSAAPPPSEEPTVAAALPPVPPPPPVPSPPAPAPRQAAPPVPPVEKPVAQQKPHAAPPPNAPAARKPLPLLWIGAGSAAAIVVAIGIWAFIGRGVPPPPLPDPPPVVTNPVIDPSDFAIRIEVNPPEATVKTGDRDWGTEREVRLPAGQHEMVVSADGYESATVILTAGPDAAAPPPVTLAPLKSLIGLSVGGGRAMVNGRALRTAGGRVGFHLDPGTHRFELAGGSGKVTFQARLETGKLPVIEGFQAQGVLTAVIAAYKDQALLIGPPSASLGGRSLRIPAAGLPLPGLALGHHPLTVSDGEQTRRVDFEVRLGPSIYAYIIEPGLVDMLITSNEDGATVSVNGQPAGDIDSGQLALQLKPGAYTIRVAKRGFGDPGDRRVVVRQGAGAENFPLTAELASLAIRGAPPGARLLIDGRPAGEVAPNGQISVQVAPGAHSIGLRAPNHSEIDAKRTFRPGTPVELSARDLLVPYGSVQLTVQPANASVTLSGSGERGRAVRPGRFPLAPGDYVLEALAPGIPARRFPVTVRPGETATVDIALARDRPTLSGEQGETALNAFTGGSWQVKDGWSELGEGQMRFLELKGPSVISFTIEPRGKTLGVFGGRKETDFLVGYQDQGNYVVLEMGSNLECFEVIKGKRDRRGEKTPLAKDADQVRIEIRPDALTAVIQGKSIRFDGSEFKGVSLVSGKFGLRGPLRIRDFQVQPAR